MSIFLDKENIYSFPMKVKKIGRPQTSVHYYATGSSQMALPVRNTPGNAGDARGLGSIPGSGRSTRGQHSNPLQYSCLENPRDREDWWATVHRVTKSQAQLKQLSTYTLQ